MKKIDSDEFDPSVEPVTDKIYDLARVGTALVPVAGGVLTETLGSLVTPPYQKRVNSWLHELTDSVNELIESGEKIQEQLIDNQLFLTSVIRCSDVAVRTSDNDVVKGLVNTVVAVAKSQTLDEARLEMYLRSISIMTSLHIKLLRYLDTLPNSVPKESLDETRQQQFFSQAATFDQDLSDQALVSRVMQDLVNEKLADLPPDAARSMGGPNYINMRLTQIGFDVFRLLNGEGV